MYKFQHREDFPCGARAAFEGTTRDFAGLEKYVPNVTKVVILANENLADGKFRWLIKFHGDGAIPVVARPVIKSEMLCWNEELICDTGNLTIEWKIETYHFNEYFDCGGKTRYEDLPGGGSVMIIDGYLNVTLKHLPGFPDSLVQRAVRAFEPFVGKFIEPNLSRFYKAMKRCMKDRGQLK